MDHQGWLSARLPSPESEITENIFNTDSQSKYPVLHEAFGGTGFLFLVHLGSQASTEKKGLG